MFDLSSHDTPSSEERSRKKECKICLIPSTSIGSGRLVRWSGNSTSKFCNWKERYGKVNEHNGWLPRDFWLEDWEKETIKEYFHSHPNDGYRRLTFMMLDETIVAVCPSSVYRVLREAGLLRKWQGTKGWKGDGFDQPGRAHEHWQTDISYLTICGTFSYLCSILDGYSRAIVHWEIRERMTEKDVETVTQRALEKYPEANPRAPDNPVVQPTGLRQGKPYLR